jgi:hypothetical protein
MKLTDLRWADEAHSGIVAKDENNQWVTIPADPFNSDFRELIYGAAADPDLGIVAIPAADISEPD